MNPLDFLLAMNDIDAAAVDEAIELMHGGTVGNDTREVINLNKHRRKTLRHDVSRNCSFTAFLNRLPVLVRSGKTGYLCIIDFPYEERYEYVIEVFAIDYFRRDVVLYKIYK